MGIKRFWVGRGAMKHKIRNPINRGRQSRRQQTGGGSQTKAKEETKFVWTRVAVQPSVRPPCGAHRVPEPELYFGAFCLAHNDGLAAGLDSSDSIALITASVEIWFIGMRGCFGTNSVIGEAESPCKINAELSRGRQ